MSKNTILFALYRLGYHSRMTGHGFRAVASTLLNELGYRPDVIERQLAHAEKNAVRAAYHRSQYLEERKSMMQQWADHWIVCGLIPRLSPSDAKHDIRADAPCSEPPHPIRSVHGDYWLAHHQHATDAA